MSALGKRTKRTVHSREPGEPAFRLNPQTDRDRKLVAAYHAARVAERTVNRYNSVDDGDEIDLLKEQLENIDESEDDGNANETDCSNERDLIRRR
jgi:hypothetical protein